jgi:glycosyltransferase involved in cell wall biosynthesis
VVRWKNRFITDLAGISTTFSILCYLVFRLLTGRIREGDIIYGRSAYFALFFTKTIFSLVGRRNRVAVELHQPPAGRFGLVRFFARKLDKAFVLTGWLKDCCQARGFQNLLVIPDGVDLNPFLALRKNTSKEHARKELNLPSDRRIICYTGHLYRSKGVESLIRCAPSFPEALFLIVGGFPENVEWCRKIALWLNADNVIFTGHLPPVQVPAYLFASDLCVYTLEPDAPFRNFTSPLKLFEYLASGNPVVAAAVPGVKEVVADGVNGLLYEPGEIEELKAKIRRILEDQDLSRRLAQNGFTTAQRYSWTRRAERVLEALE